MKKLRISIIVLLIALVFWGCEQSFHSNDGKIDIWNSSTLDFINVNCAVELDKIHLGEKKIQAVKTETIYTSVKDYLLELFEYRVLLMNYLANEEQEDFNTIRVWENYDENRFRFLILLDNQYAYSAKVDSTEKGGLVIETIEAIQVLNLFDKDLTAEENKCFASFSGLPNKVWIWSEASAIDKKFSTYGVSLFD